MSAYSLYPKLSKFLISSFIREEKRDSSIVPFSMRIFKTAKIAFVLATAIARVSRRSSECIFNFPDCLCLADSRIRKKAETVKFFCFMAAANLKGAAV
nr:MAG TPA: hypothetical protein [Caudoviricetes sp.]